MTNKIKLNEKDIVDTSKYDNLSLEGIDKLLAQRKEELKKWEKEYLKEKSQLEKEYPYIDNQLNNQHSLNKLNKKYFEIKRKIIEKYDGKNK